MERQLANQVCVVTGASTGIGRAIALQLAEQGADLVVHARRPSENLQDVVNQVSAMGRQCATVFSDFGKLPDFEPLVKDAWQPFGRVDHWINNAGGDVLTGPMSEKSFPEKLKYLWQTDVVSSLMLSRLVGKWMTQEAGAASENGFSILNLGWDQAEQGMAGDSGELFATTKGAIMAMTRSLAQSFAPAVRVNCLAPGWIQTKWGSQTSDYWDQRAQSDSLMNRWGTPEDVARAALFLCTHPFFCGHVLPVNGGFRYRKD